MTSDIGKPAGGDATAAHAHSMEHLKEKAAAEFRKFVVLFLYFWVLFGLFVLNESIALREHGTPYVAQGFAAINALVLAKVTLVFEAFDPGKWLRKRPLIFPILYEAFLLTVAFFAVHILEKVVESMIRGRSLASSAPHIGGVVGLASVAMILFVSLVPFFAFRNLGLVLGEDRLRSLVFGAGGKG